MDPIGPRPLSAPAPRAAASPAAARPSGDGVAPSRPEAAAPDPAAAVRQLFQAEPEAAVVWSFPVRPAESGVPRLGPDGLLLFASRDSGEQDARVYAVDAGTGEQKWEFPAGHDVSAPVHVGPDGTAFVGSAGLFALDGRTGEKKWKKALGGWVKGMAMSPAQDVLYVSQSHGGFSALDAHTGKKLWRIEGDFNAAPTVGKDGTIYVGEGSGGFSGALLALTPRGQEKWRFETETAADCPPLQGPDGRLYLTSNHTLHAVDPATGKESWHLSKRSAFRDPRLLPDGRIVVSSFSGKVYCVNPESHKVDWQFGLPAGKSASTPCITPEGAVLVAGEDGRLHALDGATGKETWTWEIGGDQADEPVAGPAGRIWVTGEDRLFGLAGPRPATPDAGPPTAPAEVAQTEEFVVIGQVSLPRRQENSPL